MDEVRLAAALSGFIGSTLAAELAANFVKIRQDCTTRTLERAVAGKFVETFVQCLQYLETGKYDSRPSVDDYLGKKIENTSLPEGLRICASRVARSMYTFRNKRNIAHKNEVDTNMYDLIFMHQAAAWITAELLRHATDISMQEAGALIELIQTPVGTLVEEIGDTRIIHADVSVRIEILFLLYSLYPKTISVSTILKSLIRRSSVTVQNNLRRLYTEKLIHGDKKIGYRLTSTGYAEALKQINVLSACN